MICLSSKPDHFLGPENVFAEPGYVSRSMFGKSLASSQTTNFPSRELGLISGSYPQAALMFGQG